MTSPGNGAGPGVGSGAARDDQLAGGVNPNSTADPTPITERAVVGALILASPTIRSEVLTVVADTDVQDPFLRLVVTTVRQMAEAGKPVDYVLLLAELWSGTTDETDQLVKHAGSRLAELLDPAVCPIPAAGASYAREVALGAARREIADVAERIARLAQVVDPASLRETVTTEGRKMMVAVARAEAVAR